MVNTLVESQAEVEAETLCNTLSDAQPLVDTLAESKAEVEQRRRRHTELCAATGRHGGGLAQALVDTVPKFLAEV